MENEFDLTENFREKRKVNYFKDIYPKIEELLKTPEKIDFSKANKKGINLIVELAAFVYMTNNYLYRKLNIPDEVLIMVMKTYPLSVFNIMIGRTIKEQHEYVKHLLEVKNSVYIGNVESGEFYENLKILEKYINTYELENKHMSFIRKFNSLLGINFNNITRPYSEIKDFKALIIHTSFNTIAKINHVYRDKFKPIDGISISEAAINEFNPIEQVPIIASDKQYEFQNFDNLDFNCEDYRIVLSYDNDADKTKCYYTYAWKPYTGRQINILLNGGLIVNNIQDLSVIKIYMAKTLLKRVKYLQNEELIKIDDSGKINSDLQNKLNSLFRSLYSQNVNETIENWKRRKPNDKYFNIWLEKLREFVSKEGVLDFLKYTQIINAYFFPLEATKI